MGVVAVPLLASPELLWQAPHSDVLAGRCSPGPGLALSGSWRLLLLGDGSPTRHLQTLSGLPVEIDLIAMAAEASAPPGGATPAEIAELDPPCCAARFGCAAATAAWPGPKAGGINSRPISTYSTATSRSGSASPAIGLSYLGKWMAWPWWPLPG